MPGDVESIGAEGGVTDMDKIDEIQQLTQLLGVEQATGDAKYIACVAALGESRACTKPPALPFPPT